MDKIVTPEKKDRMKRIVYVVLCLGLLLFCVLWMKELKTHSHPSAPPPSSAMVLPPAGTFSATNAPAQPAIADSRRPASPAQTHVAPSSPHLDFLNWSQRFLDGQSSLSQGVALAESRRQALLKLIQENPEEALAWSIPYRWRTTLPADITRLFELQLDGRGDYLLAIGTDFDRRQSVSYQTVVLNGTRYNAHTYGLRSSQPCRQNTPIHGIALDGQMALSSDSMRVLSADEAAARAQNQTPPTACKVCGKETQSGAGTVTALIGNELATFCSSDHARLASLALASGDAGGSTTSPRAVSASQNSWTHGNKSVLYVRVNFPDDLSDPITEAGAHQSMDSVNTFYVQGSYNQTALTTTVTPTVTVSNTTLWYASTDPYYLMRDAETAAFTAGYAIGNYDLEIICFNIVSGSNYDQWSGLGYVGAKGLWLQTGRGGGGAGVAAHELGHNYGLMHANFWQTTPNSSVYGTGTNLEYGNPYDTMGAASAGNNHFNTYFKASLGWLPDTTVFNAQTNGVYRLYAFDTPTRIPGNRYAAHVRRDSSRDYWLEFRQAFAGNPWLQSGLLLNWSPWAMSKGGTDLLDVTPDSINGLDDAPVTIGRTYDDPEAGVHITPLARGSTDTNSWIDVQINRGGFWDNQPPELTVEVENTNVAANVPVHFHATAIDPDGDTLAYAWFFDDGTFSTNNLPWAVKSWSASGDHVVRCVASDMKGGYTSANLLVTVGQSSGYLVSGQVVDTNGFPVEGVRIDNNPTNTTAAAVWTDSDGRYLMTGQTGDLNLYAFKYGYTITNYTWTNPITLISNTTGVDFVATPPTFISLFLSTNQISEADTNQVFLIVSRQGDLSTNLDVSLTVSGSATLGSDLTVSPALATGSNTISFLPGSNQVVFTLAPINDSLVEGTETFYATLVSDGTNLIGNVGEVSLSLLDDDWPARPTVSVSASAPSIAENGIDLGQFTFTRNGSTQNPLTVFYSIGGTATLGADYTTLVGVAVIPAGQSSAAISFLPIDDKLLEPNETVTVTLTDNAAYSIGTASAQITIIDDDLTTVTICPTGPDLSESGGASSFTVKRDGDLSSSLTVNYTVGGTATSGSDYVPLSGSIIIPAGETSAGFSVSALDDQLLEGTETIVVNLTNSATYNVGTPGSATLRIIDNELPTVTVSAVTAPSGEPGATLGSFTVSRGSFTQGNLAVNVALGSTAVNGVDYAPIDSPVIIPGGSSSVQLPLIVFDDLYLEPTNDIRLFILPGTNYNVGTPSSGRVQIADDDPNSVPAVSFTFSESSALEHLSPGISVSLTCTSSVAVAVNFVVIGGTAAKADYSFPTYSLTFDPGEWAKSIPLQINDNSIAESDRTIRLALYSPTNATLGGIKLHTYTIVDDDTDELTVAATAPSASETGPLAGNFRIYRSGLTNADLPVQFQVTGSASAPTDYSPLGTSTLIPAGAAYVDLPVRPNDDRTVEFTETVVLTLIGAPHCHLGSPSSATITITNNDLDTLPVVTITSTNRPYALEGGTNGQFVFYRTATNGPLTVSFTLSGTAVSGVDYVAITNSVTIPAGQYSAFLNINAIDDTIISGERTLMATLSGAETYRTAYPAQATIIIQDNDQMVWMDASDFSAAEPGEDTGEFTFTRFGTTNTPVQVFFTLSGTASNGVDYVVITSSITIPAGKLTTTLPVIPLDDALVEGPETVTLTLQPNSAYSLASPTTGTVVLMDDEPMLTLTATVPDATEGSQKPGIFTLTRSGNPKYEFIAHLAVGGSATYGADYPAFATNILFTCGVIAIDIPIYATNELVAEGAENVSAWILPDPAYTILSPSNGVIQIHDAGTTPTPIVTITNPAVPAVLFTGSNANLIVSASVVPYDTNLVTLSWTQIKGPDGLLFGSTNELQTTVSVTNTGIYIVRLTADNGLVQNYADLIIALNGNDLLATNLLHWAFNEGRGTNVSDSSSNGFGGILSGPPVWSSSGILSNALDFAGTNDCAVSTNSSSFLNGLKAFTVTLWTKSDFTNLDHGLLCADDTGTNQPLAMTTRGLASCGQSTNVFEAAFATSRGSARYISTPNSLNTNWQHWALGWSNGLSPQLFINGYFDQPLAHHKKLSGILTNSPKLIVGKDPAEWPVSWQGLIDDVRIYNRLLSAEEILVLEELATANQAPIVDAGSNTTVQITMPGLLAGTASDDGKPNPPGALTTTWTLLSGPTNVVITNIHNLTNLVSFLATGDYTFRLIADDGQIQAYDDVTITVTEPTRVDISASDGDASEFGPDTGEFTITRTGDTNFDLTVFLTIGGIASNIIDYVELPTSVTFSNGADTVKLTVTPYLDHRTEGDQSVILTLVSNAAYTIGSGEATVTIHDSPFGMWTISHFTLEELTDPLLSDENADFDHDGLVNLAEYAANLDPKAYDTTRPLVTTLETNDTGQVFITLTWPRRVAPTDVAYLPCVSSDLLTWHSGDSYLEELSATPNDNGITETVKTRVIAPYTGATNIFVTVKVWLQTTTPP
jgi:hypothetical protein